MNLHNPLTDLPAANQLPAPAPTEAPGTPAQRAFREAVAQVEGLRQRLQELRAEQAEARRRYWQQVGPAAQVVVQAREALFGPLEKALLLGYFSRLEEEQITGFIVGNARALQDRFGEDASAILRRYAPRHRAEEQEAATEPVSAEPEDASLPPHEQAAAAARARRKTKQQKAEQAAAQSARAAEQQLLSNTKDLYRQLARTHHPDLARDEATQQHRTQLMQRITEAYETNDLYTLLQLLSDTTPASASDETVLARYTQALQQQQQELKQQLHELKYGDNGFSGSTGKKREQEIRQLKRHLRAEAEYLQHMFTLIQEPAGLREVLRQLTAEGHTTL